MLYTKKKLLNYLLVCYLFVYLLHINQLKQNIMNNLNDIFNSDFFQNNIQTEINSEDAELKANGWTMKEIKSIANIVVNK